MTANAQTIRLTNEARESLTLTVNRTLVGVERRYAAIAAEATEQLRRILSREARLLATGEMLDWRTIRDKERLTSIINSARTLLAQTGDAAALTLTNTLTGEVVPLAVDYSLLQMGSQIGPGFAQMASRVPPSVLQSVVERADARAFELSASRGLAFEAATELRDTIEKGVLVGENPLQTAQRLTAATQAALVAVGARATRIMRTEMLDAYRNASALTRQANSDVLGGWQWHAQADDRTCAACWAMHGVVFPNDVPGPDDHPNGRCAAIPIVKPELSLNLPPPPTRDQLWAALTPEQQLRVLGPTRLRLLEDGAVRWSDFVRRVPPGKWRGYRVASPVGTLPGAKALALAKKQAAAAKKAATKKATKKATATAPRRTTRKRTAPRPRRNPLNLDPRLTNFHETTAVLPDGREVPVIPAGGASTEAMDRWTAANAAGRSPEIVAELRDAGFDYTTATYQLADATSGMEVFTQAEAISHWTYVGNDNAQSLIRTGKLPAKVKSPRGFYREQAERMMPLLDEAIRVAPEHGGFIGYRGINSKSAEAAFPGLLDDVAAGRAARWRGVEYTDPAYTATSLDSFVARQFAQQGADGYGVVVQVAVPRGTRSLSVNGSLTKRHSRFWDEQEMVLGRETKFRVVDVIDPNDPQVRDALVESLRNAYPNLTDEQRQRVGETMSRTQPVVVKVEVIP